MKKAIVVLIVIAFILSFSAPAYAGSPKEKVVRGFINVISSPLELPNAMWEEATPLGVKNIVSGLTWGIALGAFNTVKRAAVGIYEVVTFPVAVPKNYEPLIEDPVFFSTPQSNGKEKG